ncbi:nuclear receptor ROR-alpha B-like [Paramacrobiotus metropolitanus]|uniref:nuclear receptor ROR-alpha B-like n=1 Tax=Paramacrobiotus metropolitanus TaxID=2943436 RepID=UPI0024464DE5|nr:nuclear receptor ROR-alpha B-like [Paramacrobiotus metropolitanus]
MPVSDHLSGVHGGSMNVTSRMMYSPVYANEASPDFHPQMLDESTMENMPMNDGLPDLPTHLMYPKCRVCQGKSTGVHYGVQSCEGCKAFFKRGIVKKASYKCYFGRSCAITPKTRGRCKACRLQKCIDEGMSLEGSKSGRSSKIKEFGSNREVAILPQSSPATTSSNSAMDVGDARESIFVISARDSSVLLPTGSFAPSAPTASHTSVIKCARTLREDLQSSVNRISEDEARQSVIASLVKKSKTETLGSFLETTLMVRSPSAQQSLPGLRTRVILGPDSDSSVFMLKYWSIMKDRNSCLEVSIKAITDAIKSVYLDQIECWTAFMTNAMAVGHAPAQPETSLESMLDQFQNDVHDEVERSVRFAAMVPGFADLPQEDQVRRICERGLHIWMVRRASFMRDEEMYTLTSKSKFHYGRYWMDTLLEKDFIKYIFEWASHFNELDLSLTEAFLFVAIALFFPDPSDRHKPTYGNLLYAHYLDALVNLVGPRRDALLEKIHFIVSQFGSLKQIQTNYCLAIDVNSVPFRLNSGIPFDCLRKAVCAD